MTKSLLNKPFATLLLMLALAFPAVAQQFQAEIQNYLQNQKGALRLTDSDVRDWSISDQYTDSRTEITHTYLQQQIHGLPIFNGISSMALRQGRVVHFANRFEADALSRANASDPAVTPEQAIQLAVAELGLSLEQAPAFLGKDDRHHRWTYAAAGNCRENLRVDLLYQPVEASFRLAWNVLIAPKGSPDWWNVRIDAQTGLFLEKNNWTLHCDFGVPVKPEAAKRKVAPKVEKAAANSSTAANGPQYLVYALPVEAPTFGDRSLIADVASPIASPYGWHDTSGVAGAEFTITRGNNVYAYDDPFDSDEPGYSPDGGADLHFDFPLDFTLQPEESRDAIITNLFVQNNLIHDILYHHGFDERSGNFQANNYGRGGFGGDYVLAEAQDGGGTNNANFATPPDSTNGRMQMYLWSGGTSDPNMTVNAPAVIAGDYVAPEAGFGPGISAPVTNDVVLVDDGTGTTSDACEAIQNGPAIVGKIALIDRGGGCTFIQKVTAAQDAGAIAVIVVNNQTSAPFSMGGTGGANITIPSVMISQADGDAIKAQLAAGQTVNVTLNPSNSISLDGSLDNGIVIHEYGHGLSIRLTGGPSSSNCLSNAEQGGEGWSDWLALMLTIEPGDAGDDARGIGTYAFAEPTTGGGIRRYQYSTDMAVNPQTYGDLANSTGVHAVGEIWCQALWDMTWKLIDAEGFDPDWLNGSAGNNVALNLVVEAMKLQPCRPGYLDARDAVLAADALLYNNAHQCLIWEAFASRGMGNDAVQGSNNSTGDEVPGYELPNICKIAIVPPTALASVDVETSCYGRFQFTDLSTDIPQAWLWEFGDGNTSTVENPVYTYTVPGTYTVTLTVSNTLGSDSYALTVSYNPPVAPTLSDDQVICSGASATLEATVASGNTAVWTENGQEVFTGTTYVTPALANTTVYSVVQLEDKPKLNVGPADNTFGGGGNHNTGFDGRLLFEAFAPFRLLSVLVYAQGEGERTITLYNEANEVIQQVTTNVPNGASRVTLNMDVPVPGRYSLGNVSQNLYRNNNSTSYPYIIPNLVSIYSSNATGNNVLNFYYYFYDWEVQEKSCPSAPATVTVSVTPPPVAGFSASANLLNVNFVDQSTGNSGSWVWDFGDGSPVSNDPNPSHTYSAPGTYTVSLTVGSGDCTNTFTQTITVTNQSSSVYNPSEAFGLGLYPNPAKGSVNVVFLQAPGSPVRISFTDASGRQVLFQEWEQPADQIRVEIPGLAAGAYKVLVTTPAGTVARKLVVLD